MSSGINNDQELGPIPTDAEIKAMAQGSPEPQAIEQSRTQEPERPSWLPEKFKSAEDFARSYTELEQELGRKGQELGSLRTLNEQLLDRSYEPVQGQEPSWDDVDVDDVLNAPGQTIANVAQNVSQEASRQANSRIDQLEAQLALDAFAKRHPSYQQDQESPEFQDFVSGSTYRSNLAKKLVNNGDLDAAEELWSAWEEHSEAVNTIQTEVEPEAAEAAEGMATRGGGEASADAGPRPISRKELQRIRIEDEQRYYSPQFQEYVKYMYSKKLVK
tara:strand:- start:328 stop:1149 length:822 start_codon:yes stop_codon:yes gene_type:complete